jgi:segregation and condensation protein B
MTSINSTGLTGIIEALLFSSDKPLSVKEIKDIINQEKDAEKVIADTKHIESSLEEILNKYTGGEFSFHLTKIAGGYRFITKKAFSPWLAKLNKEKLKRKLSQSALETLAIIAYSQPITKPEIEGIRGVNVDYIVGSLLEKNLITIKGRAEAPGRPMLFGTTPDLLEYLGLESIEQLPPLKEIAEIIKSGPPDGITQSDIDFYEEINLIKAKTAEGLKDENSVPKTESDIHETVEPETVKVDAPDSISSDNDEAEFIDEHKTENEQNLNE